MKHVAVFGIILLVVTGATFAQTNIRHQQFNLSANKVAIQGYDPVTYFTLGKAVKGTPGYAATYEAVTYYFSSLQTKAAFVAKPASYQPQYGGWCAYAMGASGEKVDVDPETFKVTNGKLFLFYNKFFNNTLKTWNKDENNLNRKADAAWQQF